MIDLKLFPKKQEVYLMSEISGPFEAQYVDVRRREGRVYPDELVKNLPIVPMDHPHFREWMMRRRMSNWVLKYIRSVQPKQILDLGCGNGWFTNKLSLDPKSDVLGLDINWLELTQAARLFSKTNCRFVYGDLFDLRWPAGSFDLIILNSSIQYFPSLTGLVNRLLELAAPGGEIHVMDSPLYKTENQARAAQQRSQTYYRGFGLANLPTFYHHHTRSSLEQFHSKLLYNPERLWSLALRKWFKRGSFFPWVRIKK